MRKVIFWLSLVLLLCGCQGKGENAVTEIVKTENFSMPAYYLYYEKNAGTSNFDTLTYIYDDNRISETNEEYMRSYASIYPKNFVTDFDADYREKYGQVYIYDNVDGYEFAVMSKKSNGNSRNVWSVLHDGNIITIKTDESGLIPKRYYLDDKFLYLYSSWTNDNTGLMEKAVIYRINVQSNNAEKFIFDMVNEPYNKFLPGINQMLVNDNKIYFTGNYPSNSKYAFMSYVLTVDISSGEKSYAAYNDFYACKLFKHGNDFMLLKTSSDDSRAKIDILDNDFTLLKSIDIEVPLEPDEYLFSNASSVDGVILSDGYLCMTLSGTDNDRYIMAYNIEKEETVYMAKAEGMEGNCRLMYCGF